MRAYPRYRDSGVEWLGDVPEQWGVRRLKSGGQLIGGSGFPEALQGDDSNELPFFKVGDLDKAVSGRWMRTSENTVDRATAKKLGAKIIPAGSVVWAKIGAALLLNRRRVTDVACCIDNNMSAYVPEPSKINRDWALYWTSFLDFRQFANPGAIPSLSEGYQSGLPLLIPPLDEQVTIADYLDRETARIDTLIGKKRLLLERLDEQRTALISNVVTHGLPPDAARAAGLDPAPRFKPSGVEWLGDVPEHWSVRRFRSMLRSPLSYGVLKPERYDEADGIRLIRILDVTAGLDDDVLVRVSPAQSNEYRRTIVKEGDLVLSVVGTIGECFTVPNHLAGANLSRALARVQLDDGMSSAFVSGFFHSRAFKDWTDSIVRGTAQAVLNLGQLDDLKIPVPPTEEQRAIVDYLDYETARIDTLAAAVAQAIERLSEYRTALITAAVTGQIDVTGASS